MNLFAEIKTLTLDALDAMTREGVLPQGLDTCGVAVEPPRDPAHGDMATNAAMVLAKPAGLKPRDIAGPLAERLAADPRVEGVEVAGPGFINLRLAERAWIDVLGAILSQGADYGRCDLGQGRSANVEFVSANPTGPLHVGHTRGAVFGDALARVLAFAGWAVTREYYINDGGAQVDTLARSAYLRYREALGHEVGEIPAGLYPGDYLRDVGRDLAARFGDAYAEAGESEWLAPFREAATEAMMAIIREDLAALGVTMDVYFSEKALYGTGRIEATLESLDAQGLIYQGVLEPPKGKKPEDWEPRPQTLFRASAFGDDTDRPIRKADGSWTYFAPDIAYHKDKIDRGFDLLVDVLGADHGGYVKRMAAAVRALKGNRDVAFEARLCQLVRLFKNGEPYKMSKRSGQFVTLRDVLDEVGPDVTRFVMLMRKNDAALDFDFAAALEQSRENPVWYVQYAHARTVSVFGRARDVGIQLEEQPDVEEIAPRLSASPELALLAKLSAFPRVVESAAQSHEPHRVAFYLYELAGEFHAWWNRGHDDPSLRVVVEGDEEATRARLCLVRGVRVVIANGLGLLGVTPMDELR
ncbi:MAG: arginine--tRNA ligase [Paracoccaceae bacterium]